MGGHTYTAPAGDGYYEVIEHRAGKWGCKLSYPDSKGERGVYLPDARTYAKTLDEAKAICEAHAFEALSRSSPQ